MDEEMANSGSVVHGAEDFITSKSWRVYLTVLVVAGAIYLGCIVSPPSLMDDSDAVLAQAARTMLSSGDWVTARLDGVAYLEKPPLYYWPMTISYMIFGGHDWAARIPVALAAIGLAWLTAAMGVWAFGRRAGLYAGLCMATCVGLFLFTRVQIPDVMLTLSNGVAMWAILRALDEEESRPRLWAFLLAVSLGIGLLIKGLIAIALPVGTGVIYLFFTKELWARRTWQRLRPISGFFVALLIAAPWHILATLRNPPYFSFSFHSGPGEYHGFLWFYFINEQVLRFLNLRYPRDYNTVPRLWFWLFHFLWLFPWSVYFPAVAKLPYKPVDRAGRVRLLALCWTGFLLIFFTFSTTQEYYSMPCYPALALLLGSAMATGGDWIRRGTRVLCGVAGVAAIACLAIFVVVRNLPTPGDISDALSSNPSAYTLSLGHMLDLTFDSFAYLRLPLLVAAIAFLAGTLGTFRWLGQRAFLATALMMVLFFHAARLALVVFDPYLTSRPLAQAILQSPPGKLIIDHPYYPFSSLIFYTNSTALILNGRYNNLEYGSYAPGAPNVFIDDERFRSLWLDSQRYYLVAYPKELTRFENLVGRDHLNFLASGGGKLVFSNHPLDHSGLMPGMHYLSEASKNALAMPRLYR
jgi:4-amino-4-deoxy-L-arabinose transferase-like glycosyltransferase